MSITDELNQLIAEHGSARDALNVTLAKLRQAQSEIAVLKEAAEQSFAPDVCDARLENHEWVRRDGVEICFYCRRPRR